MFEKVSRSLKYDSNFFCPQINIAIYLEDTNTDHFTPCCTCGVNIGFMTQISFIIPYYINLVSPGPRQPKSAASCTPGLNNESFLVYTSAIDG